MKNNSTYLNIDFWTKNIDALKFNPIMTLFLLGEIKQILNIYSELEKTESAEYSAEYTKQVLKSAYSIRKNKYIKINLTYWDESFYKYGSYEFYWLTAEERLREDILILPALNIKYKRKNNTKSYLDREKMLSDLKIYMKHNIIYLLEDIYLSIQPTKLAA